jgi:murein DD-endopeptidase MepM/ murein hydrolase activator NlpD
MIPPSRPPDGPAISPRMTAVFGGLFGLATVASIVALLIQIFPVHDQRSRLAQEAAASGEPAEAPAPRRGPVRRQRQLLPGPWRLDALKDSHLVVRGEMQRRSFIMALNEAGVAKSEVYRILKAFDGVRSFDKTGSRDSFAVAMKRGSKEVVGFEYQIGPTEIYQAKADDNGLLKAQQLDMKVRHEDFATSFYVGKTLAKSYAYAGLEPGLESVIDAAFNGVTSHEAFEEGGVVKLVVVETTALGRFVGYERVRALEYRPADPQKPPIRAYWFESESVKGYVDEKGRRPSNRGWRSPIPGAPITSHFNPKRMHPVLKTVMPHNGTDFGAPSGTPVYAAFRGEVSFVGAHGPSGNLVLIDHPGGIQTGYAHLSRFATGIKKGDRVGTRQLIGYVGSTGRSTGPHLHFSAKRDGKYFDALELKLDALHLLPVADQSLFQQQKNSLDAVLEAIPLPEPPPAEEPPAREEDEEESAAADGKKSDEEPEVEAKDEKPSDDEKGGAKPATRDDSSQGNDLKGDDLSGEIE